MPRIQKTKATNAAKEGLLIPEKQCAPEEKERLSKWAIMASLIVYRGESAASAYRSAYDAPAGSQCPASITRSPVFQGLITRMRAAQGMTDDEVKGTIESFYMAMLADENAPAKQRLQAAAQWQKLRGLERVKVVQESEEDDIWRQAFAAPKKIVDIEPVNE